MHIIYYFFYFLFISSLSYVIAMDSSYLDYELANCTPMDMDQIYSQQSRKSTKRKTSPTSMEALEDSLGEKLEASSFRQPNEKSEAGNFYWSINGVQTSERKKGKATKGLVPLIKMQEIKRDVEIIETENKDILDQVFLDLECPCFMDLSVTDSGRECDTDKFFNRR